MSDGVAPASFPPDPSSEPPLSFVHLHCHSEFSLLDGANRITDLVRKAKEFEMPALALTDHGCLFGAWTFRKAAEKEGIRPIIGMEAYVAPGDRRHKEPMRVGGREIRKPYYHLVLLARDREGYQNLIKLSSIGYLEGFYYKPRIDREVIARHSGGLICTSACMAGEVARRLADDDWKAAREAAEWHANVFGDRYFLEVQGHDTPGQDAVNEKVFRLAGEVGLPVVASNDAHFLHAEDHSAHDVLLCIGLGKDHDDENRMRYDEGLYFKSGPEMAERFPDHPKVLENTLAIADQVDVSFEKKYFLPEFPIPGDHADSDGYLRHLSIEGAKERYGDPLPDEVRARLDYELDVIAETGYAGYFLITWDFMRWAREHGVPVGPGRGSAAGSLVAYSLWITNIDPLEFGLLFERFLNPERKEMPDIDIDFCFERRGEVIDYVRRKYGHDAVGQIITFGTMKSRAVVRDVGRTLGFKPSETDRIAKMIPNQPGQALTIGQALEKISDVRELYRTDERYRKLFDYSRTLEGLSRHASVHAAGVVIAPGPLSDYVPVCVQSRGSGVRGNGAAQAPAKQGQSRDGPADDVDVVTQYDMNCVDDAGMLKMDFLGLRTLTIIHDAVELVKAKYGALRHPETGAVYPTMDDVPRDDARVYEMLARGGTSGVFQFESALATGKLRAMRCDRFEDLVATNALIRPGPLDSGMTDVYIRRKLGQEKVTYPHPELEELLEPTYGIIVYQEQVMRIVNILAGYSLGEADVVRKAVGKKIPELIRAELATFRERATGKGVDPQVAGELADQIETFGRYGFNRAHSAGYSLLSYHTAWLKCHYPAEFMAALLSSVLSNTDQVVKYILESRELHRSIPGLEEPLELLPPDVNESGWKFTVTGGAQIRFGLGAVRGVGAAAVESVLAARAEGGRFETLFDFLDRIDTRALNKRACEALIAAGALDAFGHRAQLVAGLDIAYADVNARQADREAGQESLFGGLEEVDDPAPELPAVREWAERKRLAQEKEALGFFISGHPLDRFSDAVHVFRGVNTSTLGRHANASVEIPCVVTQVQRQISRRDSSEWGRITIEDFHGTAQVLAFRDAWAAGRETLQQDAVVLIRGKVSGRERDEDDPPIFLDEVEVLNDVLTSGRLALCIALDGKAEVPEGAFARAKKMLGEHPGDAPVEVLWRPGNGERDRRLRSRTLRVDPGPATLRELRELLGQTRVELVRA